MRNDDFKSEEQRAKEEAYKEYLKQRETHKVPSITDTPYGASKMRQRAKEQDAEKQRQAYLEARASGEKEQQERARSRAAKKQKRRAKAAEEVPEVATVRSRRKVKNKGLKTALIIVLVLVLGLTGLFAGALGVTAATLGKIGHVDVNKHNIGINDQANRTLKKYTNIAVLGVDSRDMEDDKGSRTDAMVIVSINNDTNEIKMFSIFRDTLLNLGDDVGLDKITHAYSYGGAEKSLYAINKNLDLNVKKAVVINWKTVAEIIDALGGIKIDIQESEIEEMNKYVKSTAKNTGSEKIKIKEPGKQTLNGAQAVTYARIRKDAVTGDYRRNERMKIVMKKTFQKAKQADLMTLKKICDNALPQAKTNLSTSEMMSMMLKFRKYEMTSSTTGWPYDVASWMGSTEASGYAWYGPPQTLQSNVVKLYDKFFQIHDYEPTEDVKKISEEISALTGLY